MRRSPRVVVALLVALPAAALTGCGAAGSTISPTSSTTSTTASSSAVTADQWCASYQSLTGVLSQAGSDAAGAATSLAALERFDQLWGMADNLGIATADQVAANQRAVASYRSVMALLAAGDPADAPQVTSAKRALTASTDADRIALKASAGRVLAVCGGPTPSTTAS
jgi:uncharacterized protein YceK